MDNRCSLTSLWRGGGAIVPVASPLNPLLNPTRPAENKMAFGVTVFCSGHSPPIVCYASTTCVNDTTLVRSATHWSILFADSGHISRRLVTRGSDKNTRYARRMYTMTASHTVSSGFCCLVVQQTWIYDCVYSHDGRLSTPPVSTYYRLRH